MIYDSFTMDCPTCGPGTVRVEHGRRLAHPCGYEPPSLVIEIDGAVSVDELVDRVERALGDLDALEGRP